MIIYLIRNKVNGKGYVGQTINTFEERWDEHQRLAKNNSKYLLHRAIRKYGIENFEHSVLAETDNLPDLDALEIYHIKKQGTKLPNGYNMTDGGQGTRGYIFTSEDRAKISAAGLGRKQSPESVEKRAKTHRGKKRSPETCARISAANKLRKLPPFSEEHKAKIAAALKGNDNGHRKVQEIVA